MILSNGNITQAQETPNCDDMLVTYSNTLKACDTAVRALVNESQLQKNLNNANNEEIIQLRAQLNADKTSEFFKSPAIMLPLGFLSGWLLSRAVSR